MPNKWLRTNMAMLQGILDAVTEESVWVFDSECTVVFANQLALERLGRRAEEVGGLCASDPVFGGRFEPLAPIRQIFDTGLSIQFSEERDGAVFHHRACPVKDEEGRVTCVACLSRDVTVQKRTEDALRLSEEKYSKAFATNPAAITMTTLEEGIFLDVNDTWVQLLGYSREEALGQSARKMRIWQTPEGAQAFTKELEEKGALHDWELMFLKKSGERFLALVSAQLLTVAGRKVILSTVVDITARRSADDALRESELRYRTLFNAIDQGFYLIDVIFEGDRAVDMHYLECNEAATRIVGADFTGRRLREIDPDFEEYWYEIFGEVARTGKSVRLQRYAAPLRRWFDFYLFRLGGDESRRIGNIFLDVTERKAAEDVLRESEERLRAVVTATSDVVYRMAADWSEMRDVHDEDPPRELPHEPTDGWLLNSIPEEDRPRVVAAMARAIETKGVFEEEHRVLRSDGSIGWTLSRAVPLLDERGAIVEWFGTAKDITERKEGEEALRLSAERYERQVRLFEGVTSTTPDFVYVFDPQGRFLYANSRLLEVWGMRLPEIIGKTCRELGYQQWHHDMHMREIAEVIGTKRSIKGEVPFEAPLTGIFGVYEYIFTPVLGPDGEVELIAGTTRDVTERKSAEEALRQTHDELESRVAERTALLQNTVRELHEKEHLLVQQGRLAAMGEMINNIAHQWRQPLNSLGLLLQKLCMLKEAGILSDAVLEETIGQAMGLINHMSRTIDDFRNFFKPDKEQVGFRLGEVVGTAIHLVEAAFKSHQISIDVEQQDDPVVYGYPSEYAQVVLNILNNAKDAFEARRIKERRVRVSFGAADPGSFLTISDNAGGVPEEIITKIFEPHFTTKGTHGTGIGLFMSKNIIEKNMNGRISVHNTGDGAEFTIEV